MSGRITSESAGRIRVLTIDAPERRNAVNASMRDHLVFALDEAFADPSCGAVVLTGAGGAFCAGFDVASMAEGDEVSLSDLRDRLERLNAIVVRLASGAKPVVAAVEGVAAGAGLSFAAACDFVVAAEGASFVGSWTRLGLAPDCGAIWSLPRRVGYGYARDLLFSGRRIGLEEARSIGLADAVSPAGGALQAALARAESYALSAPLAIAATKSLLANLREDDLGSALEAEIVTQGPLKTSADHAEARAAFLEKRPPVFRGK